MSVADGAPAATAAAPADAPAAVVLDSAGLAADAARREAWAGCIPAVFSLAADEVTTLKPPPSYHLNLPRQSFLPLVTGPVVEHFLPFAPPMAQPDSMWLQHGGEPLRWQVPIGVLYDLLVEADNASASCSALPWQLVVRFQGGLVGQTGSHGLLRSTADDAKALVRCALKESTYLRCGSARPVMDLSPADDARIFKALSAAAPVPPLPPPQPLPHRAPGAQSHSQQTAPSQTAASSQQAPSSQQALSSRQRSMCGSSPVRTPAPPSPYELFCQARAPLQRAVAEALCGSPERAVPIRAYVSPGEWRQLPVAPVLFSGAEATVGDAVGLLLPRAVGEGGRVLVQGVAVDLATPVPWLYDACAHPDGFLYLSCHLPPEPASE
jgi:autophagy-related protein 5